MLLNLQISKAIQDFEWILKVLESSENENHMDCVLKCFQLWEKKYSEFQNASTEKKVIERLKGNFWSLFKNKNTNVRPSIV
jgi:hypothetical protein